MASMVACYPDALRMSRTKAHFLRRDLRGRGQSTPHRRPAADPTGAALADQLLGRCRWPRSGPWSRLRATRSAGSTALVQAVLVERMTTTRSDSVSCTRHEHRRQHRRAANTLISADVPADLSATWCWRMTTLVRSHTGCTAAPGTGCARRDQLDRDASGFLVSVVGPFHDEQIDIGEVVLRVRHGRGATGVVDPRPLAHRLDLVRRTRRDWSRPDTTRSSRTCANYGLRCALERRRCCSSSSQPNQRTGRVSASARTYAASRRRAVIVHGE